MEHIKEYNSFVNDKRPVISYDFDGVLHRSVVGIHPIGMYNYMDWVPFEEMHERMRDEAEDHRIVVVTARDEHTSDAVDAFIKMYDLPVSRVYYTDDNPKYDILEEIGAIRHYDDNLKMDAPDWCELIHVDPKTGRIDESDWCELVHVDRKTGYINESDEYVGNYKKDGFVLMYGPELDDSDRRLYAAQIQRVLSYSRKKKSGDAEAARMVLLQDDTFRVQQQDGKLSLVKVSNGDKAAGIQGRRVVLNNDKTPIHWLTTQYTYAGSLLSKLGTEIRNIAGIRWYN